jgi:hypothetical protein
MHNGPIFIQIELDKAPAQRRMIGGRVVFANESPINLNDRCIHRAAVVGLVAKSHGAGP